MVIPQATVEGFEPRPTPADWTEGRPSDQPTDPAKAPVGRFQRAYGASSSTTAGTGTAPGPAAGTAGEAGPSAARRRACDAPRVPSAARSPLPDGTSEGGKSAEDVHSTSGTAPRP